MGRMITGALDLYGALFALLVLLITGRPLHANKASRVTRINRVMLTFMCILLTADGVALCFFQDVKAAYSLLITISCFCFYSIVGGYLLYVLEALSIPKNKKTKALILTNFFVCLLGFVYWLFNIFTSFYFDMYERVVIHAFLYRLGAVPGTIVVLTCIAVLIANRKRTSLYDALVLMFLPLLPLISSLIGQLIPGLSLQYSLMLLSLVLNHLRFDTIKDKELENQRQEAQKLRLQLTLERVKPHFIYNVLSSIYFLCEKDAEKAQNAVAMFSSFLRDALQSMEKNRTIPFSQELQMVRNYVKLEKIRFGDGISFVFDIQEEDFFLPPFSVQQLVENAIKHGLKYKEGGEIRIATEKSEGEYRVIISDNGVGFSPDEAEPSDAPSGIRNIRELLSLTNCGQLEYRTPAGGAGTAAVLHIRDAANYAANRKQQ